MLTKDNYLNQRSEDGSGLGCTLWATHQETPSSKTIIFLRESNVNLNNLP